MYNLNDDELQTQIDKCYCRNQGVLCRSCSKKKKRIKHIKWQKEQCWREYHVWKARGEKDYEGVGQVAATSRSITQDRPEQENNIRT